MRRVACDRKGFQLLQARDPRLSGSSRKSQKRAIPTSEDCRSGPRAALGWPPSLRLMGIGGLGAIDPLGAVVR